MLQLRSKKTIAIISVVDRLFKPLASLNSVIQKTSTTAVDLCPLVEATTEAIAQLSVEGVLKDVNTSVQDLEKSGIRIQALTCDYQRSLALQLTKYKELILMNLR